LSEQDFETWRSDIVTETIQAKPWWRRLAFRLSVRTLLVLVLLIGGGLGWLGHRARVQRKAVEVIEAAGGRVGYDWAIGGGYLAGGTKMPRWKWLVDAFGVDYLGNVTRVYFDIGKPHEINDEVLAEIGRLPYLEDLILADWKPRVTDAGLAHLGRLSRMKSLTHTLYGRQKIDLTFVEGLTRLEHLGLAFFPVTDADLAHVSRLTRLKSLNICVGIDKPNSSITDDGLKALEPLRGLENLQLDGTRVTTTGLEHLRWMSRLQHLSLTGTGVTSLAPLRHLVGLKILSLNETPITDSGLAPVAGFPGLRSLDLRGTPIGDATLAKVSGLAGLQRLDVARTRVTPQGLTQAARPGLSIGR
jgi:hypothetical protein